MNIKEIWIYSTISIFTMRCYAECSIAMASRLSIHPSKF